MPEEWTGDVVAKCHIYRITQTELADKVGVTPQFLSQALNGKKTSSTIRERVEQAVALLVEDKRK